MFANFHSCCVFSFLQMIFHKNSNCYQLQVLKILAWDTKNHLVYYLGTQDRKPGQQHMYVVKDPLNKDNGKWVEIVEIFYYLFKMIFTKQWVVPAQKIHWNFMHTHFFSSSFVFVFSLFRSVALKLCMWSVPKRDDHQLNVCYGWNAVRRQNGAAVHYVWYW